MVQSFGDTQEFRRKTLRLRVVNPASESDLLELGFCLVGIVAVSILLFQDQY